VRYAVEADEISTNDSGFAEPAERMRSFRKTSQRFGHDCRLRICVWVWQTFLARPSSMLTRREISNDVWYAVAPTSSVEEADMSAHPPPVPPDQRPKAGPKDDGKASAAGSSGTGSANGNLAEQGQAGNTKQNTTNKGFQQDR
jgi:hypothetical protein